MKSQENIIELVTRPDHYQLTCCEVLGQPAERKLLCVVNVDLAQSEHSFGRRDSPKRDSVIADDFLRVTISPVFEDHVVHGGKPCWRAVAATHNV